MSPRRRVGSCRNHSGFLAGSIGRRSRRRRLHLLAARLALLLPPDRALLGALADGDAERIAIISATVELAIRGRRRLRGLLVILPGLRPRFGFDPEQPLEEAGLRCRHAAEEDGRAGDKP
jgi:hypothetical protein